MNFKKFKKRTKEVKILGYNFYVQEIKHVGLGFVYVRVRGIPQKKFHFLVFLKSETVEYPTTLKSINLEEVRKTIKKIEKCKIKIY